MGYLTGEIRRSYAELIVYSVEVSGHVYTLLVTLYSPPV
jgi:hypothetical protein